MTGYSPVAANGTLPEYFGKMHAGLATLFRLDDAYIATLVGALNQINCGIRTPGRLVAQQSGVGRSCRRW
jgi:hypothetical protein